VRGKFAGLGFDPAPGNAGSVRAAADAMAGAGDRLAGSPGSMRSTLAASDWQGTSAESFVRAGAPVPGTLATAHGQLRAAGQTLRTWHGRLLVNQHAAERLDATAKKLRHEIAEAERGVLAADARLAAAIGPNQAKAKADLQHAQHDLTHLRTRLATTLRAAHRLARRHRREADSAAAALRGTPAMTSWPSSVVDGVATGVGGASAWTGQVATITLPGATDPVVALPIGAQPGDPDWPGLPTDPSATVPIDPAEIPVDLTDPAAAPVDPMAPIPPIDGLPANPADPASVRPGAETTTRPSSVVLAPPVPEPVAAAVTEPRPVVPRHQESAVARVITTPAHAVRTTVADTAPSAPAHRHSAVTRNYESVRSATPAHHLSSADTAPARPAAHHPSSTDAARPAAHHGGGQAPAEPHPLRPATATPAASITSPATPANPGTPAATPSHQAAPAGATTAETAAVAPAPDTKPGAAPTASANPTANPAANPAAPAEHNGHNGHNGQQPSQQGPQHGSGLAAAPGQQVGAAPADQGKAPSQPGGQGSQNSQQGAEHRKPDGLPAAPLAADPLPGDFTGVVLPAPSHWDGTSVAPLRAAGLLPDTGDELWSTFVIAAVAGPALIAESVANGGERSRNGTKRTGKQNRMRAFVLQPGGEQLVMLTLQGRSAEGWTTQRALFLRAVTQYRRPAEVST
jgi:hypothetical protein